MNFFLVETFPHIYNVANISNGNHFLIYFGHFHTGDQFFQIINHFIHPSLFVTLISRMRIDFSSNRNHAGNISSFGLRARHSTQTGSNKQFSGKRIFISFCNLSGGIHHGNCCTMHNALRTNVHIRSGSHLTVLRNTKCVEFFPIVWA